MPEISIHLPKELESEKDRLEAEFRKLIEVEVRAKLLNEFFDKLMKDAKQLSSEEILEFSKKFSEAGVKELKSKGVL